MEERKIKIGEREFTMTQLNNIMKRRKVIADGETKIKVKVTQVTPFTPEGERQRFIVNLAAMTPYHYNQAVKFVKEEEYQKALNQNLTFTIFTNEDGGVSNYIPKKGENVMVESGWIVNKDGDDIIVIDTLSRIEATVAKSVDQMYGNVFGEDMTKEQKELDKINAEANEDN